MLICGTDYKEILKRNDTEYRLAMVTKKGDAFYMDGFSNPNLILLDSKGNCITDVPSLALNAAVEARKQATKAREQSVSYIIDRDFDAWLGQFDK